METDSRESNRTTKIIITLIVIAVIIFLLLKACTPAAGIITFSGDKEIILGFGEVIGADDFKIYKDGKLTDYKVDIDLSKVDFDKLGTYPIIISYIDEKGNIHKEERTLIIKDLKGPTILLKGSNPLTIALDSTYIEPGYEVFDDFDDIKNIIVVIKGEVNTKKAGTYKLTYIAIDTSGNKSEVSRIVIVSPSTPPDKYIPQKPLPDIIEEEELITPVGVTTLQLKGTSTVILDYLSSYVEPGFSAYDTIDGDITHKVVVTGLVNEGNLGTYTIYYSVTNSTKQTTTVARVVQVIDNDSPIIKINGANPIYIGVNTTYLDLGASAVDNYDGVISVSTTNNVNTSLLGTYSVIYTATDSSGNSSVATRVVYVIDDEDPMIILYDDISIEDKTQHILPGTVLSNAYDYFMDGVSAIDNLDGDITDKVYFSVEDIDSGVILNCSLDYQSECATFRTDIEGFYTVTYHVEDSAGNLAIPKTKTVNVVVDPKGWSSYDIIIPTKDDVVATIESNRIIDPIPGWTQVDAYTYTKVFTDNFVGEEQICYTPVSILLCSYVNISIQNIDKTPITASVSYSTTLPTNNDVTATITTNKLINTPSGWTKVDDTHYQKSYSVNTTAPEVVALEDAVGHTNSVTINVGNIDKVAPVVTIIGSAFENIEEFENYVDPGATALDDVDGVLSVSVTTDLVSTLPKTYHITYTAVDSAGNIGRATREVVVMEVEYIVILTPDVYLIGEGIGHLTVLRSFGGVTTEFFAYTHNFDSSTAGDKTLEILHNGYVIATTYYYVVATYAEGGYLRIVGPDAGSIRVEYYSHSASFTVTYYYSSVPLKDPFNQVKSLTPVAVNLTNGISGMQGNKNKWDTIDVSGFASGYYYFVAVDSSGKTDDFKLLYIP